MFNTPTAMPHNLYRSYSAPEYQLMHAELIDTFRKRGYGDLLDVLGEAEVYFKSGKLNHSAVRRKLKIKEDELTIMFDGMRRLAGEADIS